MIHSDNQRTASPTPEGWFVAASRLARIAAVSNGTKTVFQEAVSVLRQFGPLSVAVVIGQDITVERIFVDGFSDETAHILSRRYQEGGRHFEPLVSDVTTESEDPLVSALAREGIVKYCVWPLISAERLLGELYVGVSGVSDSDFVSDPFPPAVFMEGFSSALALTIDRNNLIAESRRVPEPFQWHDSLLTSIVQGEEHGVLVTDSLGRVMLLNPAGERILGIDEGEVIGKRLSDVDESLSAMGRPEDAFKLSKGRITIMPGDENHPKIVASKISGFTHNSRDYAVWRIKEGASEHKDVQEKESRYSAFVNNDRLAVFHCDQDGILSARNTTLLRLLGATESQVATGAPIDELAPLQQAGIVGKVNECLSSGEAVFSSHELEHPQRGSIHLAAHFSPISLANGRQAGVQAIIEDTTEYIKTRSSLMRSEERYRVFFKNAPISLLEVDFSDAVESLLSTDVDVATTPFLPETCVENKTCYPLRVVGANPAALGLYGAKTQAALTDAFVDGINAMGKAELSMMVDTLLSDEPTYRFHDVHRTLGGKCIHVDISVAITPGHHSDFSSVLLSILDITQIKAMEAALKSQLVLERLISTISAKIVSVPPERTSEVILSVAKEVGKALDVDNVIIFELDGTLKAEHGWTREGHEATSEHICRMLHEWDREFLKQTEGWRTINVGDTDRISTPTTERNVAEELGVKSLLVMPLAVQETLKGVMVLASKTMPKQWLEESEPLLRILSDVVAGALDRQQRERLRRESEALLRTVFQSMAGGLVVVDTKNRVLLVNPSAARSFHLEDPLDFIGAPVGDLARGADEMIGNSTPGEQQQIVLTLNDGTKRTFGFTSASATSGQRIIVFRDLTKMLEADIRQKRAEELARLGMVVAKLSHEIKNPLASILLGLRALEDNNSLDSEVRYILSSLLEETRFLKTFVEDFLSATRFQEAHPSLGAIHPIFAAVERSKERIANRSGITLVFETEPDDTVACVDRHAMIRALNNLVKNAIEACEKGQTVRAGYRTLERDDQERRFPGYGGEVLCLYVEDTGPGLPAEVLDNLFIPFTTTKVKGNGLGLSMVRETVAGHGGVIEVITPTNSDGGGTRFEILIPSGSRPNCLDIHGCCMNGDCASCPMPEGCPVRETENYFTCWIVKGKASLQETGHWNTECVTCPVYLSGNLEHFYLRRSLRKEQV